MAELIGTAAADTLLGTSDDDAVFGLDGNDALRGLDGTDRLEGGLGADLLIGGRGDDVLEGGAESDTASWVDAPGRGAGSTYGMWISLAAGLAEAALGRTDDGFWWRAPSLERDTVDGVENASGSTAADHIAGDAADNRLHGLAGDDELLGLGGNDRLYADIGDDGLFGGEGDDALFGAAGRNELHGEAGEDALYAGAGEDTLLGGGGDDLVFGGDGDDLFRDADGAEDEGFSDRYEGGAGADTVDYRTAFAGIVAELAGERDSVRQAGGEVDRLLGIENVTGSEEGDLLAGDERANLLTGLGGDDRLYGRAGDDTLIVGSEFAPGAANTADGSLGDDALRGWGGSDDRLYGGVGADTLTGGSHRLVEAPDADFMALGQDADADRVTVELARSVIGVSGGGIDRVGQFDPASDVLELSLRFAGGSGPVSVADAADFLDSDNNGVLNDADRDVAERGGDLVLDLAAVFERAFATGIADDRPQAVVLLGLGDIGADSIAAPTLEPGWILLGEPNFLA